jgi:pimeloyl-ACP methyl ester carboxylesterase
MHGWRREADFSFPGRILIVFDQRGTGLSSPKLDCREAEEPIVWWPISKNPDDEVNSSARVHAAFAACMARHLAAGRKLQVFNTLQSATDVEALRRALELGDIVLYGLSYGTRLALTVMKFHPEHIEAAILDSVFPPQAEYAKSDARTFGPVLDRLFEACNQDKDCAAAYPDLRSRLLRVLEQLAREPAIVEIVNLEGGEPLYAQVDHRMFLSVLRGEMYHTARLPNLPVLISGVAQGEYWRLKQHVENSVYGDFPSSVTMGARLAVVCNDDPDAVDRQPESGDAEPYPYLKDFVEWGREYPLCGFWTTNPETRNRDAVVSDVPSLLLAGGLDASTTVEQAEMAAETLPVSHLFVFPANAHVQLRINPCAWEVVDEFLANPAVRPRPDCLASLRRPAFLTYGGN